MRLRTRLSCPGSRWQASFAALVLLFLAFSSIARAEEAPPSPTVPEAISTCAAGGVLEPETPESAERAAHEASIEDPNDLSGSCPVNLQDFVSTYATYKSLPGGGNSLVTNLRAGFDFADRRANIRLTAPVYVSAADGKGLTQSGFGDAELKMTGLLLADQDFALGMAGILTFDTAGGSLLGGGQTVFAPLIGAAGLVTDQFTLGGTYQYNVALANHTASPDVKNSQFDLYLRWNEKDWEYWFSANPEWIVDHARGNRSSMTLDLTFGHALSETTSIYLNPGLPIGANRPYDWKVEVGLFHTL